ncbi:MAG TPA: transcriptional regulator [Steroidobacteraceae bacterium]|nr:transcriptional regulator [Steroidobacteraceae bacterium]
MPDRQRKTSADQPFAYRGIDRVIHEHARLSLLTSLVAHPRGLSFGALKRLCALTDGNLSRHLQVLEAERIVALSKEIEHNRPLTVCRLTARGRRRYFDYLAVLEQVILDAARAAKAVKNARGKSLRDAPGA